MGPLHRSSVFRFKLPALRIPSFLEDREDTVEDIIRLIDVVRTSLQKLRGCIVQSEPPSLFP
jgi:hypothetical protein